MPHLRFRGIPASAVQSISQSLPADLAEAVGCPADWFTFEHIQASFFFGGEAVQGPATAEVLWFDRGVGCQDRVAALLYDALAAFAGTADVCVMFGHLEKIRYYENGKRMQ